MRGYVLSMSATVTSSGTTSNRIGAADVGFGLGTITRSGTGVNATGTDTNATSGDPTLPANGSVNATSGRYEFTAVRSNLSAFSSADHCAQWLFHHERGAAEQWQRI